MPTCVASLAQQKLISTQHVYLTDPSKLNCTARWPRGHAIDRQSTWQVHKSTCYTRDFIKCIVNSWKVNKRTKWKVSMCLLSFFICRNKKFEPPTAERRMLQANLDKQAISTIYNNRDLTHLRRRRRRRRLVKKCISILLWNFSFILDLFSVSVGIETCSCWIYYECFQLRKIRRCGSRSPHNAEFGHFTLLFCRARQRNVLRIIMHVHSYCSAN